MAAAGGNAGGDDSGGVSPPAPSSSSPSSSQIGETNDEGKAAAITAAVATAEEAAASPAPVQLVAGFRRLAAAARKMYEVVEGEDEDDPIESWERVVIGVGKGGEVGAVEEEGQGTKKGEEGRDAKGEVPLWRVLLLLLARRRQRLSRRTRRRCERIIWEHSLCSDRWDSTCCVTKRVPSKECMQSWFVCLACCWLCFASPALCSLPFVLPVSRHAFPFRNRRTVDRLTD